MHKFFKKKLLKPIVKKTLKKFAPELRELIILHLLHKKPSHGYELIKYFQEDAPTDLETKANRVYPSLEKMMKKGLLKLDVDETISSKKPRKIYSLTESGRAHLEKEILDFKNSLKSLNDYVESLETDLKSIDKHNP